MAAGSTYTPIATTTLGTAQSSVTFSSLGSYTDIVMVCNMRGGRAGTNDYMQVRFNSDSGTNYSQTEMAGDGTSATSGRYANSTSIFGSFFPASSAPSGEFGNAILNIQNYSNATTYKTLLSRSNYASGAVQAVAGLWRSTSAITSITLTTYFSSTFIAGSTFTLYGIQAA